MLHIDKDVQPAIMQFNEMYDINRIQYPDPNEQAKKKAKQRWWAKKSKVYADGTLLIALLVYHFSPTHVVYLVDDVYVPTHNRERAFKHWKYVKDRLSKELFLKRFMENARHRTGDFEYVSPYVDKNEVPCQGFMSKHFLSFNAQFFHNFISSKLTIIWFSKTWEPFSKILRVFYHSNWNNRRHVQHICPIRRK